MQIGILINMKESSGNARKELYSLKDKIDGLQREIEYHGLGKKELSKYLEERDRAMIYRLSELLPHPERLGFPLVLPVRGSSPSGSSPVFLDFSVTTSSKELAGAEVPTHIPHKVSSGTQGLIRGDPTTVACISACNTFIPANR